MVLYVYLIESICAQRIAYAPFTFIMTEGQTSRLIESMIGFTRGLSLGGRTPSRTTAPASALYTLVERTTLVLLKLWATDSTTLTSVVT